MTTPSVLPYGRSTSRRRRTRFLIAASLLLALILAVYFARARISLLYSRYQGTRAIIAWYQQARTFTLPPDTLVYSEDPADLPTPRKPSTTYVNHSGRYPALRIVAYTSGGIPLLYDEGILFVHERLSWDTQSPTGSSPQLVAAKYEGLDSAGVPQFNVYTYRPITGRPAYFRAAITRPAAAPDRPLTHLRLFAGQPDPANAAQFYIPFSCTSGTGRFTFVCDTDPSDGGRMAPAVSLSWDSPPPPAPPPTHPTSRPSTPARQ